MGAVSYGPEKHKEAYEIYVETRNMKEVERRCSANYLTIFKWRELDYKCKFGCPYHGWEKIIQDARRLQDTRLKLISHGEVDPVKQELAMTKTLEGKKPEIETRKAAILQLVISDEERIQHWQLIYCKSFYKATGIALDYDALRGLDDSKALEGVYKQGLSPSTFGSCVSIMAEAQAQIQKLRGALVAEMPVAEAAKAEKKKLTLDDLRKMKELAQNTSPDELSRLKAEAQASIE